MVTAAGSAPAGVFVFVKAVLAVLLYQLHSLL